MIIINTIDLLKMIYNVAIRHYELLNSIVSNRGAVSISKFWLLRCYLLWIRKKLFTTFYPPTNSRSEKQNNTKDVHLQTFVNIKRNNFNKLLAMAEFAYKNPKNMSIGQMLLELNCCYHPRIWYKGDIDACSNSKLADKLQSKFRELITVCQKKLHHAKKLQKRSHDENTKLRSYGLYNKVWLNNEYIKIKQNCKLETKFFRSFWILQLIRNQAYKSKLLKK